MFKIDLQSKSSLKLLACCLPGFRASEANYGAQVYQDVPVKSWGLFPLPIFHVAAKRHFSPQVWCTLFRLCVFGMRCMSQLLSLPLSKAIREDSGGGLYCGHKTQDVQLNWVNFSIKAQIFHSCAPWQVLKRAFLIPLPFWLPAPSLKGMKAAMAILATQPWIAGMWLSWAAPSSGLHTYFRGDRQARLKHPRPVCFYTRLLRITAHTSVLVIEEMALA